MGFQPKFWGAAAARDAGTGKRQPPDGHLEVGTGRTLFPREGIPAPVVRMRGGVKDLAALVVVVACVPLAAADHEPGVIHGTTSTGDVDRYGGLPPEWCLQQIREWAITLILTNPAPGDAVLLVAAAEYGTTGSDLATGQDPVAVVHATTHCLYRPPSAVIGVVVDGERPYTLEYR